MAHPAGHQHPCVPLRNLETGVSSLSLPPPMASTCTPLLMAAHAAWRPKSWPSTTAASTDKYCTHQPGLKDMPTYLVHYCQFWHSSKLPGSPRTGSLGPNTNTTHIHYQGPEDQHAQPAATTTGYPRTTGLPDIPVPSKVLPQPPLMTTA